MTPNWALVSVFLIFFSNLWRSSSPMTVETTFLSLSGDLPSLDGDDCELLIKPVSKNKVYSALRSMPRGKSPGPDRFSADFYLFYWNLIGDHLFKDVAHFFSSSKLPKSWCKPSLSLFPRLITPFVSKTFVLSLYATSPTKLFLKFSLLG